MKKGQRTPLETRAKMSAAARGRRNPALAEWNRRNTSVLNTRHGHVRVGRRTPTYSSWAGMVSRCTNPNQPGWKYYGARGITVCDRWRTFDNFLADMGERPDGKTLDRKDNDGNYEPGNCQWATPTEQVRNRRSGRVHAAGPEIRQCYADGGITKTELARRFGVSLNSIRRALQEVTL